MFCTDAVRALKAVLFCSFLICIHAWRATFSTALRGGVGSGYNLGVSGAPTTSTCCWHLNYRAPITHAQRNATQSRDILMSWICNRSDYMGSPARQQ
jgi:hypothetical protein